MIDNLINDFKILICCGSGGVGKTTLSAAIGVRAAQQGKRVLVLTIDPAKRLVSALGIDALTGESLKVPGQNFKGELFASVVDPKIVFDQFVLKGSSTKEQAEKIINNKLYYTLTTTLSGSQEFSSLERLFQAVSSENFDLIILDTPPAQHAKEFLLAPQRFFSLFQDSLAKWLLVKEEGGGLFSNLFQKTTLTVLKTLENLTGSEFISELTAFFIAISDIQSLIQSHSVSIHRMLTNQNCGFLVVTSFDETKLLEAKNFQKHLKAGGYNIAGVLINRSQPSWWPDSAEIKANARELNLVKFQDQAEYQKLLDFYEQFKHYFLKQDEIYRNFQASTKNSVPTLRIIDYGRDITDLDSLSEIANDLGESKHNKGDR